MSLRHTTAVAQLKVARATIERYAIAERDKVDILARLGLMIALIDHVPRCRWVGETHADPSPQDRECCPACRRVWNQMQRRVRMKKMAHQGPV